MNRKDPALTKTRLTGSYITLIISVSLVLFLLGILGLVLINAHGLSKYFRENLSFSVILDEDAREADIRMLQRDLDAKVYVKSTQYISKDQAAAKLKEDLGEDFVNFLGYNPLSSTIDVYLYANYTHPDSVKKIEKYILEYPIVKEVYYQESLLYLINENVQKISIFLLVISLFLFLIALTIINNTIRLSIYSKRFLIRTMQLVGATRAFIRKPFLVRSAIHGLIAALIALILLMSLIYLIEEEFFRFISFGNIYLLLVLSGAIIILGIVISVVSSYFSVNKYLSISEDKLYY
ncbi:MAG TPA: permease-like cell division protein FtsX [Bacteroidales bacterium]|nr:permease-like cell division protein FtsX [Bacteroidales bacterium]HOK75162.1 permease-like cell division protein FtsX [Bacteroidales bacterium]HOM40401.1 permease-like cell division protein FtsX [Bacteroidales bacterium]HPP93395.1 permease-like cell division protein FtsX [Bacteroidales bacterium]HRR16372.1 permease-like cell division protein FtsX [Bacteroidales bacterium]